MPKQRIVVIGLSGYSLVHLETVRWLKNQRLGKLGAVVALESEQRKRPGLVHSFKSKNVPIYDTVDAFLENGAEQADILTVPIGIHLHVPISIAALRARLHVYCEKPIAATIQEVDRLIRVQVETGRKVAIGFQHVYSHSIRSLKTLICNGKLGKVRTISLLHGWPRSKSYFLRNDWAGRLKLKDTWVLDSPANNAMAHYLLNLLYLASSLPGHVAEPSHVRAELYRANEIESADTIFMRLKLDDEVDAFVALTHCNRHNEGPFMRLDCERGRAYWQTDTGKVVIRYKDGKKESFDNGATLDWRFEGLKNLVESIRGGYEPLCTPGFARAHTLAVNAMHESCPEITTIPDQFVFDEERQQEHPPNTVAVFRTAKNLDADLKVAFEARRLASELKFPWAGTTTSTQFDLGQYLSFPRAGGELSRRLATRKPTKHPRLQRQTEVDSK